MGLVTTQGRRLQALFPDSAELAVRVPAPSNPPVAARDCDRRSAGLPADNVEQGPDPEPAVSVGFERQSVAPASVGGAVLRREEVRERRTLRARDGEHQRARIASTVVGSDHGVSAPGRQHCQHVR